MRVAIQTGLNSFSERWIQYCQQHNISYKLVNCYCNDILYKLLDCDLLLWHHDQNDSRDILFAKQLLYTLEHSGKKVFPDFKTSWHFDDKVGQKYLFEALGFPYVNTYIFYEKEEALRWAKCTSYPKVFKLRGGAGSENVRLVKNYFQAGKLIRKSFRRGFRSVDPVSNLRERFMKYKNHQIPFRKVFNGMIRLLVPGRITAVKQKEKGYVYFQDYIPGNGYDIRVIVIGSRAFAIKRIVRENDFRASGSGMINYDPTNINIEYIKLSFELNCRLRAQCVAYDFVKENGVIKLLEISYGFLVKGYRDCPGFWDDELNFHYGTFSPEDWIIENVMKS